ncbi:energy transducer TonB [Pontibacter cellulosilyticus]|uniref:TonB family protein n=1 Tax=Pontibacter cellulosilyticus TaxID=1720253 RepID=A0A923N6R5_9BACT|nr:energy transducer TonB [Pontibacter cellulosilyticus]MBC5993243.1 TonB family protein [Pontibacter cellulosilyticus]
MKTKFTFLFILFAFATLAVSAQTTEAKAEAAQVEEKKVWTPEKTPPVAEFYEGGVEAMYKAIYKELNYPALAKRNRVQGDCIVSFTLNEDGSLSGFKVLRNAGAGTGEEALRVTRLLKFKAPGFAVNASIPIMFKL